MIRITTNIGAVSARLQQKFKLLTNDAYMKDKLLRTIATTMGAEIGHRIHDQGQNADGDPIGEYSNPYLRTREKYGYSKSDKKVILSLTRNMRNDFAPIATVKGYGLGFKNPDNADKVKYAEDRYGKIYGLTEKEQGTVSQIANQFTKDHFGTP